MAKNHLRVNDHHNIDVPILMNFPKHRPTRNTQRKKTIGEVSEPISVGNSIRVGISHGAKYVCSYVEEAKIGKDNDVEWVGI